MKQLIILAAIVLMLASCKKDETPCYQCQWVRNHNLTNEVELRCGDDVPNWATTVRINQPNYYPVCARIK